MTDQELIISVREKAIGLAFGIRWGILELCRRFEQREPVVRCKDCRYYEEAKMNELGFIICRASGMEITEKDFCSYGERKDGDGNG